MIYQSPANATKCWLLKTARLHQNRQSLKKQGLRARPTDNMLMAKEQDTSVAMTFTVVEAQAYINRLKQMLPKAKKRIVFTAMVIRSGPVTEELLRPLVAAAKRGVAVHVLLDRFTLTLAARPNNTDAASFKQAKADTLAVFDDIKAAGGRVSFVGKKALNPYAGRYHAKITVIDDAVFSFGGVNMSDESYDNIDYMLHTTDHHLADALEQLVAQNAQGEPARDVGIPLAGGDEVLFDAGQKRQSIIYNRACQLARQAETVWYVSQMAPTGALAKLLAATRTTYFANQPSKTGWRPATLAQWLDQHTNGLENQYEGAPYIHAKFILYSLKNGQKALLSGSHNFSWRGVAFGTQEIALCSYSPELWRSLHNIVYTIATAD
jgi:hypothetical protein